MRIALVVADTDGADAGLGRALRGTGQQVTEHVMDGGHAAGPRAAVPGLARALRDSWSRTRPEVVHAVGWAAGLAALAAARDAEIPVVAAFGSLAVTERRHGLMPKLERTRLERAIALASGAVIAASSEEAADLVAMGVSRRRVHMVPAGVDAGEITQDGPTVPARGTSARAGDGPRAGKARIVTVADPDGEEAVTLARAAAAVPGAELIACRGGHPGEVAALLRSMAAADRARSRYSWDRVATETVAVYQRAAEAWPAAA